jgi:hypothetical protein
MKCIHSATGKQLLDEIHTGQCGVHATSRTLVGKDFRSRFYWITAKNDATELVQKCEACQFLSKQQHLPVQQLQTIPVTCAFACCGLDMIDHSRKLKRVYPHTSCHRRIHKVDIIQAHRLFDLSKGSGVHSGNNVQVWNT